MKTKTWHRAWMLGFLLLLPTLQSCVTTQGYNQMVEEKDAEIRKLRDERAALKMRMQGLQSSLDSANGELTNASARLSDAPDVQPSQEKIPELDNVGVTYGMRDGNMVISIPSSITFASGQATLSKDGEKALKEVASTLKKKYPGAKFAIEGHTDTDPIKKSKFSSNRDLSLSRASAVHAYLVQECGIADKQCIVAGYGEYEPVAPNDNKDDKARNRRVEIVVHKS